MKSHFTLALAVLFAGILFSFRNFSSKPGIEDFSSSEKEEAGLISVYLGGNITASETLTQRVLQDLHNIREVFGKEPISEYGNNELPRTLNEIRFQPPWQPGVVLVEFEDKTWGEVMGLRYASWSALNRKFGVQEIKTFPNLKLAQLICGEPLHSELLAEEYLVLPGVKTARFLPIEDAGSRVYPSLSADGTITYLFDKTWGECRQHCEHHEYFYFASTPDSKIEYIGFWNKEMAHGNPDWWYQALENVNAYKVRQ